MPDKPKILLLDLECAPKIAYVWKFFKEFVKPDMVIADGFIMTASWKWLDGESIYSQPSNLTDIGDDKGLCQNLRVVLHEADIVIAHNARKFDIPLFNARCLYHEIEPPSPYKIIDTLEVARKKFKFDSNSLENLARVLKCKPKGGHTKYPGFTLWKECLQGNLDAWAEMEKYNADDVTTLEQIYLKMRPWMDQHPNVATITGASHIVCPKCGSTHVQRRGTATTSVARYYRYQCMDCGGWSRSRIQDKSMGKVVLSNAGVS